MIFEEARYTNSQYEQPRLNGRLWESNMKPLQEHAFSGIVDFVDRRVLPQLARKNEQQNDSHNKTTTTTACQELGLHETHGSDVIVEKLRSVPSRCTGKKPLTASIHSSETGETIKSNDGDNDD